MTELTARRFHRRHGLPVALWTSIWALFFLPLLLGWQRLPTSDFTEQFLAFARFQSAEMWAGRLPLWSPYSYGGVPFVADPQTAVFYFPRWLTIGLNGNGDLSLYALTVEALLHVWLAGLATYGLAYATTRNRWAGLTAAVIFGLGGYLVSYPLLQLAILETIAWLPLLLLLLRLGVTRRSVAWLMAAVVVMALSASAGHPQTFLHVGYTAVAYFLFLVLQERWAWRWVLSIGLVMALVGTAVAATYWLPLAWYQPLTTRAEVGYNFVAAGQPLLNYLQLLMPATLSLWSPEYMGLAGLLLAVIAWLARPLAGSRRAEITFWGIFIFVVCWLALGDSGILFRLVYLVAPGFSLFRQQERLLGVAQLVAALLAAEGLALWLRLQVAQRRDILRWLVLLFGILFGLTAVILVATRQRPAENWPLIYGRQLLLALAVLGLLWWSSRVARQRQRPWLLPLLLVVLLGGDLYMATLSGRMLVAESPTSYWQQPDWLQTIVPADDVPERIDSQHLLAANAGEVYGWEDVRGISPLKPQFLADLEQLPRALRWRLLNVGHVLAAEPMPEASLSPVAEIESGIISDRPRRGFLYEVTDNLPRAWMVYTPLFVPDRETAVVILNGPDFDPARQVVLTEPVAEKTLIPPPPPAAPNVVSTRVHPGRLRLQVETAAPGFVVISEWHYPGWRAVVDGEPAAIEQANASLMAVWVPSGFHELELWFWPTVVPVGIGLTLFGLLLAVVLARRWRPAIATRPRPAPELKRPQPVPVPAGRSLLATVGQRVHGLWLMTAVTLAGFVLRVYRLGAQELRGDEGISYGYALKPAIDIVTSLRNLGNPHSPLHYFTLRGWLLLTGESELTMRLISVVPGVLTLPLTYQLGRRLVHRRFGLLAAGLMAVAQGAIWMSQDARNQYMLAMVFGLAASLLLLEAIKRQGWLWVAYALAAALTVYGHIYGLFVLLAHGAYLLARQDSWQTVARWMASGVAAALLFAPWLVYSLPTMISVGGHFRRPTSPNLARHLTDLGMELAVGTGLTGEVGRWLYLGMGVLVFLGLRYLWHRRRPTAVFLLTWLIGAALGIFLIRFSRDTFNTYYINVAAPAWWLLLAAGIFSLGTLPSRATAWRSRWPLLALTAVLLVSAFSLGNYYFNPDYSRAPRYREAADVLATAVAPEDVIVTNYPDAGLAYYLRDIDTPKSMQPDVYQNINGQAVPNLEALAAEYERLWFIPAAGSNHDPESVALRWFDYHMILEAETQTGDDRLTLSRYRPPEAAAAIMTPLGQTLVDGRIRLENAYATVAGQPVALRQNEPVALPAGGQLEVTLLWSALAPVPDDYTVFVHFLAADGRLLTQHDGIAAFGTRPTSLWPVGDVVVDKHRLNLPAAVGENGRVLVGLYNTDTIERAPFASGETALWLGDFVLVAGE